MAIKKIYHKASFLISLLGHLFDKSEDKNKHTKIAAKLARKSIPLLTYERDFSELNYSAPATSHAASKKRPGRFYETLIAEYQRLHLSAKQTDENLFNGSIFLSYLPEIVFAIKKYGCRTLLDYGSGSPSVKYLDILGRYGLTSVVSFEPGLKGAEAQILQRADLVCCFDVLEHVHIEDLFWVCFEIFSQAEKVLVVSVSSRLANAKFKDGNQVHITLRPAAWWAGVFESMSSQHPRVKYFLCVDGPDENGILKKVWFTNRSVDQLESFYSRG